MATGVSRCLVVLVLYFSLQSSDGLIKSGVLVTDMYENWEFLARFCFLSRAGKFSFEFVYPTSYDAGLNGAQNIILYHDDQWAKVYSPGNRGLPLNCTQREAILNSANNQVIYLTTRYTWSGCTVEQRVFNNTLQNAYVCKGGRTFSSARERWWYIVVDNCKSKKGLYLEYKITMTNDQDNRTFFTHYSADEFYILQTDIGFLVAYVIMMGQSIYVAYSLTLRQLYHTTYKIYMASIIIELLALFVQVGYWADYGRTGLPKEPWKYVGRFLEYAGTTLFLVLLILMAKGYTITRGRISTGGNIKIVAFTCSYIAIIVAMFIVEAVTFDPALVLYIYDSIPGYVLIALRLVAWVWFIYGIFFTLKNYPEKRTFYYPFIIIYTIWFWTGPIVALIALDTIPRWTREKTVNGMNLFALFLGHLVFLILTWPTLAGKNFPFHIRTTQIADVNNPPPGRSGDDVIDGAFMPTTDYYGQLGAGEQRFVDIFTTDRSRSHQGNGTNEMVNIDKFPHATTDQPPAYNTIH